MDDNPARFARFGGAIATHLNPVAVIWVLVAIFCIFLLPRRYLVVPFCLTVFTIPLGQSIVLGGLNFLMFRLVIIAGLFRTILSLRSGEGAGRRPRFNVIDKAFLLFCISSVITFTILFGDFRAFVNHMGFALDALGTYFLLRLTLHGEEDVDRTIKVLALVCGVVAVCMLNEQFTTRNLFSVFGGVPKFTDIRDGALRSQGPFEHPILSGVFGAIMLPLFVRLWWRGKGRIIAFVGTLSALTIIITSKSSTPLAAGLAGLVALGLWPFRRWMRLVRWGIVLGLVGLQTVMKAPVWALIGRAGAIAGSSGYHRYILVDNFIRRFGEWWLVGVKDTAHWGYDMWDVTNQYVATGVSGGLVTLILFLAVIVYCFKGLGLARKEAEADADHARARGVWAMGAALIVNLTAFFGITYFDQTQIAWYALLAIIASVTFDSKSAPLPVNEGRLALTSFRKTYIEGAQHPISDRRINWREDLVRAGSSRTFSGDRENVLSEFPTFSAQRGRQPLPGGVTKRFG